MIVGETDHLELAEARQAVYRFLLAALDKPSPAQHEWFNSDSFRATLEMLGDQFGVTCPTGQLAAADPGDHEARYIACFEAGLPEPPVPLLASHYNCREPVPATIHEHVLFYLRFGSRLAEGNIEPADHLLCELAFLVHLDDLLKRGTVEAESIARGRRDFLERQAGRWPAHAARVAKEKHLPPVYQSLLALLACAVAQDRELTPSQATKIEPERP